jgi:hypothetical protein
MEFHAHFEIISFNSISQCIGMLFQTMVLWFTRSIVYRMALHMASVMEKAVGSIKQPFLPRRCVMILPTRFVVRNGRLMLLPKKNGDGVVNEHVIVVFIGRSRRWHRQSGLE